MFIKKSLKIVALFISFVFASEATAAILSEINTNFKNSKKHGIKIAIFVKNQK